MTDSDTSGAAQPDAEDDAKKAAAERPGHRRSVFWDHQDRIRALLADGRSYRQILCILRLKEMHRSVLARWCARQGLHSQAPGRPGSRSADKPAGAPEPAPAPAAAPASPEAGKAKSLSELLSDDEAALAEILEKFFPQSNPQ